MNALECTLEDWQACRVEGSYSSCALLPDTDQTRVDIVEVVVSRIYSSALSEAATQDVHRFLLRPSTLECSPFERILLRSGRTSTSSSLATIAGENNQIHFLRFWQATEEVWRRIHQQEGFDDVPLVEELAPFRDAVLRRYDACTDESIADGGVSLAWLSDEVSSACSTSADPSAWQLLANAFTHDQTLETLLPLHEAAAFIYPWVSDLVADYRHGPRGALVQAVIDVAKCSYRDACWHLGASAWDVEPALISIFASRGDTASACLGEMRGWSSGGAKLRQSEVECPICMNAYGAESKSVSTHCCFQTLCDRCRRKMNGVEGFHCPFCRGFEKNSKQERRKQMLKAGSNLLFGRVDSFFQAARGVAGSAGHILGELADAMRENADNLVAMRENVELLQREANELMTTDGLGRNINSSEAEVT